MLELTPDHSPLFQVGQSMRLQGSW